MIVSLYRFLTFSILFFIETHLFHSQYLQYFTHFIELTFDCFTIDFQVPSELSFGTTTVLIVIFEKIFFFTGKP
jgi:hypothetical protein